MPKLVPICHGCKSLRRFLANKVYNECHHPLVSGGKGKPIYNKNIVGPAPDWCPMWPGAEALNEKLKKGGDK